MILTFFNSFVLTFLMFFDISEKETKIKKKPAAKKQKKKTEKKPAKKKKPIKEEPEAKKGIGLDDIAGLFK